MQFFGEAVNVLQTLVIALGAGLCVWGGINLMEGYGNENSGAKGVGISIKSGAAGNFVMANRDKKWEKPRENKGWTVPRKQRGRPLFAAAGNLCAGGE